MASIDKIYVKNKKQYLELGDWVCRHSRSYRNFTKEPYLNYFFYFESDLKGLKSIPVMNLSYRGDLWLAKNCPFKYVITRLKKMYGLNKNSTKKELIYEIKLNLK